MGVSTTHLRELVDEELLQIAKEGASDVVKRIVSELARRHHKNVVSFVYGIVRDQTAAEDLAQEAFVRIFRHVQDWKPIGKFTTWLLTIARNLALNEIRDRKKRPTLVLNAPANDTSESEAVSNLSGDDRQPSEEAQRSEAARELRRAVEELPEPFRVVLVLCDLQQLSYQECADTLDLPLGTVRSRLSRARGYLEERLRKHRGGAVA